MSWLVNTITAALEELVAVELMPPTVLGAFKMLNAGEVGSFATSGGEMLG